jgi:hypothetical protein
MEERRLVDTKRLAFELGVTVRRVRQMVEEFILPPPDQDKRHDLERCEKRYKPPDSRSLLSPIPGATSTSCLNSPVKRIGRLPDELVWPHPLMILTCTTLDPSEDWAVCRTVESSWFTRAAPQVLD